MAGGRYSRVDGRNSASNGLTVPVVVFVALCTVGIWVMTSSSLIPVQNARLTQENKTEVNTHGVDSKDNAKGVEDSKDIAKGMESSKDDAKGIENSNNVQTNNNDAKGNGNSNIAAEDNASRDEGKQKHFEDSEGNLPADAIKSDSNESANPVEKNDRAEGVENNSDKSEDKTEGSGVENKEEQSKDVSDNGEGKKVDGDLVVENKDSEPAETTENNVVEPEENKDSGPAESTDNSVVDTEENKDSGPAESTDNNDAESEKGSEETSGKIDEETQDQKKEEEEKEEKVESKTDDNEKSPEENSENPAVEKQENPVEEKVDDKKDDSEKMSEGSSGNAEGKKQDDMVEEKVENKKDDNEEKSEQNIGKRVVEKDMDRIEESAENKNGDSGKESEENEGKTDVEKRQEKLKKVENSKDDNEKTSTENSGETDVKKLEDQVNVIAEKKQDEKPDQGSTEKTDKPNEVLPSAAESELSKEATTQDGSFSTQAIVSKTEKEARKASASENQNKNDWKLCKTNSGPDYIPCLDNLAAISKLPSTKHFEHRERHCPEEPPTCLVPMPPGYKRPIEWPNSRDKIWYHNVPHTKLAKFKGHQNWVKLSGELLTFPGGGTQFINGALHYIDLIQKSVPEIAWGKRSRVVLDVGCGVASFGGFLFDRDTLTMSMAPNDEHEAQVQFALERGIPAISAVMGTMRLPYPAGVFDVVHCARCRVPWHNEGGKLLLELNRLLRAGGFFVWSATPVYRKNPQDAEIWQAMKKLTKAICWELLSVTKDKIDQVGIAIYRKPSTNECYEQRSKKSPPLCPDSDDPNAAWNVPMKACMHKLPSSPSERGSKWPEQWPARVEKAPYWLSSKEVGVYGKPAPEDFVADYEHWKRVVKNSYLKGLGIKWSTVRNVMDMRAVYGGLAAALKEQNIWVLNVVSIDAPDTLPIIYERGLFGIYHDWCESFSSYPRTYDLLHADHLFSKIKNKCNFTSLAAETDRLLRPEGKVIVRDDTETIAELEITFKSLQWNVHKTNSKNMQGMIVAHKTMWRPTEEEPLTYSLG